MSNGTHIYENVKHLCKENGIKVGEIERAIGMNSGYFSRKFRKGEEMSIPCGHILYVSKFFGVSMEDLMTEQMGMAGKIAEIRAEIERLTKELEQYTK